MRFFLNFRESSITNKLQAPFSWITLTLPAVILHIAL